MIEKKPLNIEMGRRIRAARERAGISREKLAEYVEITPRFVADIERGSVGVSVANLKKICETLHISSDSVLWDAVSPIRIDERLKLLDVDSDCLGVIDKMLQCQIELIELMRSRSDHVGADENQH